MAMGNKKTILVVDDEPELRNVLAIRLSSGGYEVIESGNGKEAIAALASEPFDVVLMDVEMPEMDGIEATKAVRAMGIKTPIVAITAHAFGSEVQKCLDMGMNDYISKPVKPESIATAIEKYLSD